MYSKKLYCHVKILTLKCFNRWFGKQFCSAQCCSNTTLLSNMCRRQWLSMDYASMSGSNWSSENLPLFSVRFIINHFTQKTRHRRNSSLPIEVVALAAVSEYVCVVVIFVKFAALFLSNYHPISQTFAHLGHYYLFYRMLAWSYLCLKKKLDTSLWANSLQWKYYLKGKKCQN